MKSMKISFLCISLVFQLFNYPISGKDSCQQTLDALKSMEGFYASERINPTIPLEKLHEEIPVVVGNALFIILFFFTILVFLYNFNFHISLFINKIMCSNLG